MRFHQIFAGLVMLVALFASGCASGSDSPATSDTVGVSESAAERDQGETGEASSSESAQDVAAPDSAAGDDQESTDDIVRTDDDETRNDSFVSPVFDALGFDPNDRQEAQDEYVANAEELVRACMADAGFEYIPNIPSFGPSFSRQLELNETISQEQFTAEYGYGISTLTELDFASEGVMAFVEILLGPAPEEARSEGEQAAYELALSGRTIQGLTAEEAQEQAFDNPFQSEDGSCRSVGYENADNTVGEKFDGLFSLLGDEFDAIQEDIDNDPRIRDLLSAWQTCMAGHGYSYERPEDALTEVNDLDEDLRNRFQTSPEALSLFAAAGQADLAGMNADDRFSWLESNGAFGGFAMVPGLQAELDELIQFELTVAAHDASCADADTYVEVAFEYEEAFVQEHAAQLELIAAGEA